MQEPTPIKSILEQKFKDLEKQGKTIAFYGADPLSSGGYTQVPNVVLVSNKISSGAKLTYAMLLKYAWEKNYSYPGQERLAKDMGTTSRSVRTYLNELEKKEFIFIKQRGLGKTNLYILNFQIKPVYKK
ncbi:hypothetical protein GWN26_07970 [Candidatus Saccharibacteria bacterium]|nr:helix-turn-helix domain-containing protein [Candidatus Saccharibacteria bacterium]NIU00709.1 helix-turn-helix domain-containing protein [Nitrosopumilaceae archaeon]NIV03834.1 hypothetical protein [Calditrichia bacterium]NIV99079.1 hypothetical protein [Candidatus Saccharibacteria bacterium]NIW79353.1 hypothetical protein [Calditrichia bacterium]